MKMNGAKAMDINYVLPNLYNYKQCQWSHLSGLDEMDTIEIHIIFDHFN